MENESAVNNFNPADKGLSSFKLIKNSKSYGWEIKVYDEDINIAMNKASIVDSLARAKWGDNEEQRRKEIKEHHAEEFAAGVL